VYWDLATFRPGEDPPEKEIIAEVFESVFGRSSHEKEGARLE
jgi:hypothetical protein